jgi:hypothetical protein
MIEKFLKRIKQEEAFRLQEAQRKEIEEIKKQPKLLNGLTQEEWGAIEYCYRVVDPGMEQIEKTFKKECVPEKLIKLAEEAKLLIEKENEVNLETREEYEFKVKNKIITRGGNNTYPIMIEEINRGRDILPLKNWPIDPNLPTYWKAGKINLSAVYSYSIYFSKQSDMIEFGYPFPTRHFEIAFEYKRDGDIGWRVGSGFDFRPHDGNYEDLAKKVAESIHNREYYWEMGKKVSSSPETEYERDSSDGNQGIAPLW